MDFGKLCVTHEIIAKLHGVIFSLNDDPTYEKEDVIHFLQEVFEKLDELVDLLKAS